MDLYFYLWLLMSACAVAFMIMNRQKQKVIDEYKSLCKDNKDIGDVGKLEESIESADKLIKEQQETIEDLRRRSRKYLDMMEELKKQAAEYTPMKSMADYTEKITKFSEQAEDMFGLYIDSIHIERANTMLCRSWKINMKTSGNVKQTERIK